MLDSAICALEPCGIHLYWIWKSISHYMTGYSGELKEEISYIKANPRDLFFWCTAMICLNTLWATLFSKPDHHIARASKIEQSFHTYINLDSSQCLLEQVRQRSQSNWEFFQWGGGSVLIIELDQRDVMFVFRFFDVLKIPNLYKFKFGLISIENFSTGAS